MKLAQKQIDYKIRQGLFFIIKECGNTTFLRLFVFQYFHENLVKVATMILSCHYRESLTWLLNTSEFLTYEKKSLRVLTVATRLWFPIRVAREVLLIHWSGNWPPSRTHTIELTITSMITGLFNLSIMICHHVKTRHKGLCLSCPFWAVRRRMERLSLLWRLIFLGHFFF